MRSELFNTDKQQHCRDSRGYLYMDNSEVERIKQYLLPSDKEEREKTLQSWKEEQEAYETMP